MYFERQRMSVFIELAGMVGGMLSEYMQENRWPWWKIFLIPATTFFSLFSAYVIFFPSEKGMLAGFAMASVFGLAVGFLFLLIFLLKDRFGKRR
jgi:FtsH-binding integral membrane protein